MSGLFTALWIYTKIKLKILKIILDICFILCYNAIVTE